VKLMTHARPIARVLIANRGEIARRIIRTCTRLGIETVAVYTVVDAHAPHVREATFAEPIGDPESYLSIEKILDAATRSHADSVHPGYGFLSENPDFAAAVREAGLTWIGPSSETIRKLGSKTAAKELARQANAPTSPTLILPTGPTKDQALAIADFGSTVGFPLIIKAAAGGGGRGMRFINPDSDISMELDSARRESLKAFGSDEVFVEKCITPARHIEVQIVADTHGNVVALGTRDCSLQRSNQKIIEEAPATKLVPGSEQKLLNAAISLARAAGYTNLGTVEFLYGADGSPYFLEVNTRLQVEHPVTELVTGLDLVELQLRIAAGETLAACGVTRTPEPQGHAIEARWCAEEFTDRFTTATGVVLDIDVPQPRSLGAMVRVDRGVEPCSEVSHYYDSLIGKVIAYAPSRERAIEALDDTLSRSRLSGVRNNRSLLLHLLRTPQFKALHHTVQGTKALLPSPEENERLVENAHVIAAAARCAVPHSSWSAEGPWLSASAPDARLSYPWRSVAFGRSLTSVTRRDGKGFVVAVAGTNHSVIFTEGPFRSGSTTLASYSLDGGAPSPLSLYRDGNDLWVHTDNGTTLLHQQSIGERSGSTSSHSANEIRSSIPGKVAAVVVKEGDSIEQGDTILVLDSMKMEHPIRATTRGTIVKIPVQVGTIVQAGELLVTLKSH
jgi:acetyl/propionyl-CoA carboxylase alpha subunit